MTGARILVVKAAVMVIDRDGREVIRLDATYDMTGVPEPMVALATVSAQSNGYRLIIPTQREESAMLVYAQRKAEYDSLPWFKRIFTRRPWLLDTENFEGGLVG